MSVDGPKQRRRGGRPAQESGPSLRLMVRLAAALFLFSFFFGGLPQSAAVRERLARAGLVSTGRPELVAPATTTTLPPKVVPDEINALLGSTGYPGVVVTESDRVVTLDGTVPDEASRQVIIRLVRDVPGVEDVIDRTVVAAPGTTGDVTINGTSSHVMLEGAVPDVATADAVLSAVQAVYVADQIDGAVTVDPELVAPVTVAIAVDSTRPEIGEGLRTAFDAIDPALLTVDLRFRQLAVSRLEQQLDDLLGASPIEFAVGSSQLDDRSATTLDQVAELLTEVPDAVVEVGGHTDDSGGERANRQLSADRAERVVAELRDRGVTNDLRPVGYGETRPRVTPFDSDEARAANRRIEFLLVTS